MNFKKDAGYTLLELLVTLSIFSVISLAIVGFMGDAFNRINLENRASLHSVELRNALNLIASELRMSSSISPYIPGMDTSLLQCSSFITVSSDTLKFLVTHDDSSGDGGVIATYVGYIYDGAKQELRRAEVELASIGSCMLPSEDPLEDIVTTVVARNLVAADSDNNGAIDPIFNLSGNVLTVSLGYEEIGPSNQTLRQSYRTQIIVRANNN